MIVQISCNHGLGSNHQSLTEMLALGLVKILVDHHRACASLIKGSTQVNEATLHMLSRGDVHASLIPQALESAENSSGMMLI